MLLSRSLIVLAILIQIEVFFWNSKGYAGPDLTCRNSHLLLLNTMLGRKGFFGWLNDDFSESITAYDEFIKCFAKTKEEKTFALTLRGLSKQSIGDIKGACSDWVLASEHDRVPSWSCYGE